MVCLYSRVYSHVVLVLTVLAGGHLVWTQAPVIKLDTFIERPPAGAYRLKEDYFPAKSLFGLLEVTGPDEKPMKNFQCSAESRYLGLTAISDEVYKMSLVKPLDRETQTQISVRITCAREERDHPTVEASTEFFIDILDVNDNKPAFMRKAYQADLTENSPAGTFVLTVTATDLDSGNNGNIEYSIRGKSTLFSINNVTGEIFTKDVFDREQTSSVKFVVVAKDNGEPRLHSKAQVTVNIADVNDNAPVIETHELVVEENQPPMTLVGILKARDEDAGLNHEVFFNKIDATAGVSTSPFFVQPNGKVFAAVSLDRELKDAYSMLIAAVDKGTPPLTSTRIITVNVQDVNDNTPMFLNPSPYNEFLSWNNNSTDSVVIDWHWPDDERAVFQAEAIDNDKGMNGQIVYGLQYTHSHQDGKKSRLFRIDPMSGQISLSRYVLQSDDLVQVLNISARDKGNPSLITFATLNVTFDVDVAALTTPATPATTAATRRPIGRNHYFNNRSSVSSLHHGLVWLLIIFFLV